MNTFKQRLRFVLLGLLYATVYGVCLAGIVFAVVWISAVISVAVDGMAVEAVFGIVIFLCAAQCMVMCCCVTTRSAKNKRENDNHSRKKPREEDESKHD